MAGDVRFDLTEEGRAALAEKKARRMSALRWLREVAGSEAHCRATNATAAAVAECMINGFKPNRGATAWLFACANSEDLETRSFARLVLDDLGLVMERVRAERAEVGS